jgi:hypothetical protein
VIVVVGSKLLTLSSNGGRQINRRTECHGRKQGTDDGAAVLKCMPTVPVRGAVRAFQPEGASDPLHHNSVNSLPETL